VDRGVFVSRGQLTEPTPSPLIAAMMRTISDILDDPKARRGSFLIFWLLSTTPFLACLIAVGRLSLQDDNYSYVLLVPLISAGIIYKERRHIFRDCQFRPWLGLSLFILGALLYFMVDGPVLSTPSDGRLSIAVFAVIVIWTASFILFYGTRAVLAAKFPFSFLLFMIPIPTSLLAKIIAGLQYESADVTHLLFRLAGIPVFRQGLVFSLPGIHIHVEEACSGIHSTLALLMVGILAGHLCLQSTWRKLVLTLLTIPISIIKNALRIAVISGLGVYVDRGFLYGPLHRYGGYPFAAVALAMLGPVFLVLWKSEGNSARKHQRATNNECRHSATVG